jgi:hypothetical protein
VNELTTIIPEETNIIKKELVEKEKSGNLLSQWKIIVLAGVIGAV